MNEQLLIFSLDDLVEMMTHYTQGAIPLNAKALGFNVSPFMERWLMVEIESDQWDEDNLSRIKADGVSALHVRYEGKKILKLGKNDVQPSWETAPDGRNQS